MRGFLLFSCLLLSISACTPAKPEAVALTAPTELPLPTVTATPTPLPPTATPTPPGGGGRIVTTDPLWRGQLFLIDPDGSHSERLNTSWLQKPDAPGYAMEATWSPDGSKIAFAGYLNYPSMTPFNNTSQSPKSEIFIVNADGTGLIQITRNNLMDETPAWSPDGTKIAFASSYQIYVMNADGTEQRRLTHDDAFDWEPSWSPDGTKIAFSSDRGEANNFEIFSMNANGTAVAQLTSDPGDDIEPAWSPDGTKIAFASERKVGYGIYLMNPDGSGQTSITGPEGCLHPVWSPDGKMIAYAGDGSGEFCLIRLDGSGTTCKFGADNWLSWSGH